MAPSNTDARRYSFGEFTLDVARRALMTGDGEVRLRPQSFDVLCYLVEHRGRLVMRDELLTAIWGNTVVTDGSLTQCLIDARRAIRDESRQLIRTVPRRGYIFDAPVTEANSPATPAIESSASGSPIRRRRWRLASGAALALVAATTWWLLNTGAPVDIPSQPRQHSIAVLPFVDMSQAQDQAYFSDGISEQILNTLAQSPDLLVIARTSSFSFKGKDADIATIADMLNVSYVLEGSVRRSGSTVRITAQLVDAATSAHLWSQTYDRDMGNTLGVQSEIAAAVAKALKATLAGGSPPQTPRPESAEAYELYLQGRFFHTRRAPGDSQRQRAVQLDPLSAVDHANLAHMLAGSGRLDEALAAEQEVLELNPAYAPDFKINVGFILILQRRLDEALSAVEQWPEGKDRDKAGAMIYHALGEYAEAEAALEKLIARPDPHGARLVAEVYGYRGKVDEAFEWLENGYDPGPAATRWDRQSWVSEARLSPFLIPLRDDPRWEQVVAWEE